MSVYLYKCLRTTRFRHFRGSRSLPELRAFEVLDLQIRQIRPPDLQNTTNCDLTPCLTDSGRQNWSESPVRLTQAVKFGQNPLSDWLRPSNLVKFAVSDCLMPSHLIKFDQIGAPGHQNWSNLINLSKSRRQTKVKLMSNVMSKLMSNLLSNLMTTSISMQSSHAMPRFCIQFCYRSTWPVCLTLSGNSHFCCQCCVALKQQVRSSIYIYVYIYLSLSLSLYIYIYWYLPSGIIRTTCEYPSYYL